jgi:uncharacterized protein (DUF736 family)
VNHDNTNSGALFKNDKQGKETRPDYKGTINVNGVEFWLSAWIKSSKAGQKYMSLSVQPKEARADDRKPERATTPNTPDFSDDIPF